MQGHPLACLCQQAKQIHQTLFGFFIRLFSFLYKTFHPVIEPVDFVCRKVRECGSAVVSRDAVHGLSTRLCSGRSVGRVHKSTGSFNSCRTLHFFACSSFRFAPVDTFNPHPHSRLVVHAFNQCAPVTHQDQGVRVFHQEKMQRPWLISSPRKMIGAKPCPVALQTTDFVVLRHNGPDPEWLKA